MRKGSIIVVLVATMLLGACGSSRLYYWGTSGMSNSTTSRYEQLAYGNYDKQTPESICALIVLYEDMVSHPGGSRRIVPPGICAEYGFLLLQESTASVFEQYATNKQKRVFGKGNYATMFAERGEAMMQKEMELYPESARFIAPLVKRLTGK